jgi:ubiquinone/menaquinone biosynthesis C-methylase UbiE
MAQQPNNETPQNMHVCPTSGAFILTSRIRRLIHNPDKILGNLIRKGQTVLDIGCGPGFFSLAMARIVGDEGRVIAADLQQEMLDMLHKRAEAEGLDSRIRLHRCQEDRIGLDETVDFALAFYMVHEVPNTEGFLREMHSLIKPGGLLLIVEPKFHVSASAFEKTVDAVCDIGFKPVRRPRIMLSRSILFKRDS